MASHAHGSTLGPLSQLRPGTPTNLTATGGDRQVTVTWSAATDATHYRVFRRLENTSHTETPQLTVAAPSTTAVDTGLDNGLLYFYVVIAVNDGVTGNPSMEVSARTEATELIVDAPTRAAFRLLRQATWGPRPADVDYVKLVGAAAFLDEQFSATPSTYPDELLTFEALISQRRFIELALNGPDQLRQRVAWALHKIWVVSAVDPNADPGMAAYLRLLMQHAFGNYRNVMEAITLNAAMGRFQNVLDNRSQAVSGSLPNENYGRELLQLFTIGTVVLDLDGTPTVGPDGAPIATYTQADVSALSRILTGWTFGDGNPTTVPSGAGPANYSVPMEAVPAYHDTGAKRFLGQDFAAGRQAADELSDALDLIFNHPSMGPFVATQLIAQLVTSNPSRTYVQDIALVFNNNGSGIRGDLRAVVRAILLHPEADATASGGKLSEPILHVLSVLRILNANVANPAIPAELAARMGQNILYAPSVFSYFSPTYRARGTTGGDGRPLIGPEFQLLTPLTVVERANFIALILTASFGSNVTFDLSPYETRTQDAAELVDYCNLTILGGRMTSQQRAEIIAAVRTLPIVHTTERAHTAVFLALAIATSQVDR